MERRGMGRGWWLVAVCGVLLVVVGVWSFLIAEDWGGRINGVYVIAVAIPGLVVVRRKFVGSRSR